MSLLQTMTDLQGLRDDLPSPDAAFVDLLLGRVSAWSTDDTSLQKLLSDLDRILGNVWFSTNERHAQAVLILARLRDAVANLGGMTMNERLYAFRLLERWDQASSSDRALIRAKLEASEA